MVSINEIKEKINLNTAQSNYKEALRLVSDFSVDDRLLLNDVIKKLYDNISVNIQKYNIKSSNIIGIIDKNPSKWGRKIGKYTVFLKQMQCYLLLFLYFSNSSASNNFY